MRRNLTFILKAFFTCIHTYIYIYVCLCMFVYMYVCMYVCVCAYMYASIFMYVCMYVFMCVFICMHACMCMYAYIYVCVRVGGIVWRELSYSKSGELSGEIVQGKCSTLGDVSCSTIFYVCHIVLHRHIQNNLS